MVSRTALGLLHIRKARHFTILFTYLHSIRIAHTQQESAKAALRPSIARLRAGRAERSALARRAGWRRGARGAGAGGSGGGPASESPARAPHRSHMRSRTAAWMGARSTSTRISTSSRLTLQERQGSVTSRQEARLSLYRATSCSGLRQL